VHGSVVAVISFFMGYEMNEIDRLIRILKNPANHTGFDNYTEHDILLKDAVKSLVSIGTVAVDPLILALSSADCYNRNRSISTPCEFIIDALRDIGDARAMPALISILGDIGESLQMNAFDALEKFGTTAVDPLIAALSDEKPNMRKNACIALARLGDTRAVEPLIHHLNDVNLKVKDQSVGALGVLKDLRAVNPLLSVLRDPECPWFVRKNAAEALFSIGTTGQEALLSVTKDNDTTSKILSFTILTLTNDFKIIETLTTALRTEDPKVRWTALFESCNWESKKILTLNLLDELLNDAASDKETVVREMALRVLSIVDDPRVIDALFRAMVDKEPGVKGTAEELLGKTNNPQVIERLKVMLNSPDEESGTRALRVLTSLKSDIVIERLIEKFRDKDFMVVNNALDGLINVGKPAVDLLLSALKDGDFLFRKITARALALINDPEVVEHLLSYMNGDYPEIVCGAYTVLLDEIDSDKERLLLDAIKISGDVKMAGDYLCSCNAKLIRAARKWIKREGFKLEYRFRPTVFIYPYILAVVKKDAHSVHYVDLYRPLFDKIKPATPLQIFLNKASTVLRMIIKRISSVIFGNKDELRTFMRLNIN
jgi:HEAT repeat protein